MEETKKKLNWKEIRSFVLIVVGVMAFRSMFFEPFRIPSGSMIPTLNIGDFIVVNKFSYGFKLPFSDMFSDPIYLTSFESPKRGDVVVFKYPKDTSQNYIKRVIGLPGDEIEIVDKKVFLNGVEASVSLESLEKIKDFATNFSGEDVHVYKAKIDENEYYIQRTGEETVADNIPKFTVPADSYFVLGDNRDFSADSRFWGFVPKEHLKGKAFLVWMSFTLPLLDDGFSFTPSRIGTLIK